MAKNSRHRFTPCVADRLESRLVMSQVTPASGLIRAHVAAIHGRLAAASASTGDLATIVSGTGMP